MRMTASHPPVPVPDSAIDLLARSDAELLAATVASTPDEAFVHAHLAALRAGAAVLQVRGRPGRRSVSRTVWEMVATVAPELAAWAAFFADNAAARSAVEAGRTGVVDVERAQRVTSAVEEFQLAVRSVIGLVGHPQGRFSLRAS